MKIPYIGTSAMVIFFTSIFGCGRYLDRAGKKGAAGDSSSISKTEVKSDGSAEANKPEQQVALAPPCEPPKGISNDPQNINDVILLLNSMPKPVTMPCYLQVLKRPLRANATASILSVQPAADENNPRIFLFSGPSLIQSFVPMESSSKAIEFSFLLDDVTSIKGRNNFSSHQRT